MSWEDQCWDRRGYWREKRADADCLGNVGHTHAPVPTSGRRRGPCGRLCTALCIHPPSHPPHALFLELERGHPGTHLTQEGSGRT